MKKILLFITALTMLTGSFASVSPASRPPLKASEVFLPVGKTGAKISLLELSQINVKEFQQLTDRKLSFFDKMKFRAAQKKLRDGINHDGTLNTKKFEKAMGQKRGSEEGFHVGGFLLGLFLGGLGVLICFLINDEMQRNREKWAWIGTGVALVLTLILTLAVFSSSVN